MNVKTFVIEEASSMPTAMAPALEKVSRPVLRNLLMSPCTDSSIV